VPFAFPRCPRCQQSWATNNHRGCRENGELDLDPDAKRVHCKGCGREWAVWDSRFYCNCGHEFSADDVEEALRDLIRAAATLADFLDEHRRELARIREAGDASLRSWLNRFAQGVAGALGTAVGHLINVLFGG